MNPKDNPTPTLPASREGERKRTGFKVLPFGEDLGGVGVDFFYKYDTPKGVKTIRNS
jgi:hypothetical protein